jgi:hypothetical protein
MREARERTQAMPNTVSPASMASTSVSRVSSSELDSSNSLKPS